MKHKRFGFQGEPYFCLWKLKDGDKKVTNEMNKEKELLRASKGVSITNVNVEDKTGLSAEAWNNKGNAYANMKKYDEAIDGSITARLIEDAINQLKNDNEDIKNRIEELKKALAESTNALRLSKSDEEYNKHKRDNVKHLCKLALLTARYDMKPELHNYLSDLKLYCDNNYTNDISNAIRHVEYLIKNNIPIDDDFLDRLSVILNNIMRENGL